MFGLSIIQKRDDVLLTASTGAAAANISGATYHSALSIYGNKPVGQAVRLRLIHKKIFIIDEISMVGLEDLVTLDRRCNSVWDSVRENNTLFGRLPIVIFLGDFNQFQPVGGHSTWTQNTYNSPNLLSGRNLWCHLNQVVFLTEQMRQAGDLPFQHMLQRARSGALTEDDVAVLNSQTVDARLARGEVPPDRAVVRINKLREEVNIKQLEVFAKKRNQKIYLFPGRHDGPRLDNPSPAVLLKKMFQLGEAGKLKGPGFFAFSKGMPIMLLQNTNTSHGLVNGMTATAEEAILDKSIQGKGESPLQKLLLTCYSSYLDPTGRPLFAMHYTSHLSSRTPSARPQDIAFWSTGFACPYTAFGDGRRTR